MTGPRKRGARTRVADAAPLLVPLDFAARAPLHRQIYEGVRDGILAGRFAANMRLPSTRVLAAELGVARNTVVLAFDQLVSEGYLSARRGGGTRVRASVPDSLLSVHARPHAPRTVRERAAPAIRHVRSPLPTRFAQLLARNPELGVRRDDPIAPFALGMPAIDAFPFELWARITARRWRKGAVYLGYAASAGDQALRNAIAAYVTSSRGARCSPDQLFIVSGAQQALDLAARVLLEPGDSVWMEDPGYAGARAALAGAGARVIDVPVDEEGMDVSAGERAAPDARLAYVTPSHQYPLGTIMSASRRLSLLNWARRVNGWVLEDDYDSEFRYSGRPIPCLQGLDAERGGAARVLYIGTFSKTLAPALRLGYLIVPEELVDIVRVARAIAGGHSPTLEQGVLADFIGEGHYMRHVRRVRALCAERQQVLLETSRNEIGGAMHLSPDAAGLHMVGWLAPGTNDAEVAKSAARAGVDATPLSACTSCRPERGALLLGYAAFDEQEIRAGVRKLAGVLTNR
ncbi:MAG TPA: PLP-dependent aminotransferase family protein [Gemmatimonadaceae bacterium]|nr:PLP-dependent aminotransferase family protein [Gemmatimonadaceae bacterium]